MVEKLKVLFLHRFDSYWIYEFDIAFFIIFISFFSIYFFVKLYLSRKIDDKELKEKKSLGFYKTRNIIVIFYVIVGITVRSTFLVDSVQPEGLDEMDFIAILLRYFFSFGRFTFLLCLILLFSYFLKWLFKIIPLNKLIKNKTIHKPN